MRVATGLFCLFLVLFGCKGSTFADKDGSRKDGDAAPATDDTDDAIALEPTAVGGAYLGCFVDLQLAPEIQGMSADELPVGCQVFEDSNFNRIKEKHSVVVESGAWEIAGNQKPLVIQTLNQHPRWAWATRVPPFALHANLFLQARSQATTNPVSVRVELMDFLPSGLITGPQAMLTGAYKMRIKGTFFCADGNPVWGWDALSKKPIVDPVMIDGCSESLNFRFTRFESGLRIHVPNPNPLTCDTDNYAVEHCNDSCVDLENFGIGSRFVLWACTKSLEAQSYKFTAGSKGSVRIEGNGRPLTKFGALLVPDVGSLVEFEIVPVLP